MMLLPPAPNTCPICATAHHRAEPHNAQSLYYMYRFYGIRGRWPTWADAMAHCGPTVQILWKQALQDRGAWTEPESGDPIADPPMESVHQPIGDLNSPGYGPEFNP